MIAQIKMRRGTTAEWAAASPVVLAAGEQGYDTTLGRFKMGDGTTAFSALEWNTLLPYPVGSIYMSVISTSPATLFGGTWAAWGAGRVPVGLDAGQTEFDTVEETGGASTHTHGLTAGYAKVSMEGNELAVERVTAAFTADRLAALTNAATPKECVNSAGLGGATNAESSLPPYIVCYMWKRTA